MRILHLRNKIRKPVEGWPGERFETDSIIITRGQKGHPARLASGAIKNEEGPFMGFLDPITRDDAKAMIENAGGISRCERR